MTNGTTTKSDTLLAIEAMLNKTHTVTVNGAELVLRVPSPEGFAQVKTKQMMLYTTMESNKPDMGTILQNEEDLEAMQRRTFDLTAVCIWACIEGLSTDDAGRLLHIAGGELSDLAVKARALCGMDFSVKMPNEEQKEPLVEQSFS